MKHCQFERKATMTNGREKIRCKYDGSIRNSCPGGVCPHFQPTFLYKILNWWRKRDE